MPVSPERLRRNREYLFQSSPDEAAGVSAAYGMKAGEVVRIKIQLDPRYYSGTSFRIKTYHHPADNCYIQRAALNGASLDNCWFYHQEFAQGGLLELWLRPEPNRAWGRSPVPLAGIQA